MERISCPWSRNSSFGSIIGNTATPGRLSPAFRAIKVVKRNLIYGAGFLVALTLVLTTPAQAANPLTIWKDRLFGEQPAKPRIRSAPAQGVVLLGLNRPERIVVGTDAEQRKFPKGLSRFREIELQREFEHVAVRIQVIADNNPNGRGNAVLKPVLYVLDDKEKVSDTTVVEPLEIDIRPFKTTRLLACVNLENVRRFAIATPSSASGKFYESRSRDKLKASSKGGFYYSTDAVNVRLPYVETGELIIEVKPVNKKGEGC